MQNLNIALIQTSLSWKNPDANLEMFDQKINTISGDTDLIVLPEMFNCPYDYNYFSRFSETFQGETASMLSGIAKELNIYIIGGSIPEKDRERIYNFKNRGSLKI